jgi:hypothetical protein
MDPKANSLTTLVLIIYGVSLLLAVAAACIGLRDWVVTLSLPALALSGVAVAGHVTTMDDDAPGGYSNPDGDMAMWAESVRELKCKFWTLCLAVAVVVLSLIFGRA